MMVALTEVTEMEFAGHQEFRVEFEPQQRTRDLPVGTRQWWFNVSDGVPGFDDG
jgi:hypothetical protein